MTRLRVLPIYCARPGDPTHYLVLDRVGQVTPEWAQRMLSALRDQSETPVLLFVEDVELPDTELPEEGAGVVDVNIDVSVPDSLRADLGIPLRSSSGCAYGC